MMSGAWLVGVLDATGCVEVGRSSVAGMVVSQRSRGAVAPGLLVYSCLMGINGVEDLISP